MFYNFDTLKQATKIMILTAIGAGIVIIVVLGF